MLPAARKRNFNLGVILPSSGGNLLIEPRLVTELFYFLLSTFILTVCALSHEKPKLKNSFQIAPSDTWPLCMLKTAKHVETWWQKFKQKISKSNQIKFEQQGLFPSQMQFLLYKMITPFLQRDAVFRAVLGIKWLTRSSSLMEVASLIPVHSSVLHVMYLLVEE